MTNLEEIERKTRELATDLDPQERQKRITQIWNDAFNFYGWEWIKAELQKAGELGQAQQEAPAPRQPRERKRIEQPPKPGVKRLRGGEAAYLLGVSYSTFKRGVESGKYPRPIENDETHWSRSEKEACPSQQGETCDDA